MMSKSATADLESTRLEGWQRVLCLPIRRDAAVGALLGTRGLLPLGPKRLHEFWIRFDIRRPDEIETIWPRRHDRVQANFDRRGLSREIDDETWPAMRRELARQDRGRHLLQAHLAHELAE